MDPELTLADGELTVDPGGTVGTTARVRNRSDQVEQYRLEVLGDLARYATVQPDQVQADVDREQAVTLLVRPPRSAGAPRGAVPLGLRVVSLEDETRCAVAETTVLVGDVLDLAVTFEPVRNRGRWSGLYRYGLHNGGTAPVRVHLDAKDNERQLAVAVAPSVLTVAPGVDATGYLRVRVRWPRFTGRSARLAFTASATPLDTTVAPSSFPAAFDRLPVVGRVVALAASLGLAGLVAAAVVILRTPVSSALTAAPPTVTPPPPHAHHQPAASSSPGGSGGSAGSAASSGASGSAGASGTGSPGGGSPSGSTGAAGNAIPVHPFVSFELVRPQVQAEALAADAVADLVKRGYKGVRTYQDPSGNIEVYLNVSSLQTGQQICAAVTALPAGQAYSQCDAVP